MDPAGELVCITLYKTGAKEVIRRMPPALDPASCQGRPGTNRQRLFLLALLRLTSRPATRATIRVRLTKVVLVEFAGFLERVH